MSPPAPSWRGRTSSALCWQQRDDARRSRWAYLYRAVNEVGQVVDVLLRAQRDLASARAHARSGDSIQIAGYLGGRSGFDEALASFAEAYADQSERDYHELVAAHRSGRIQAWR
jgi:Uncharacterized protein conserved in bacteria (DUF2252)/DDE domain